ncbi:MAG TPA: MOSC N-terminal beta barrel domain-containing protein [Gammaproteobacteria bacterium]|nr:MOSC N-terminal beta barrel domain-containing protein [Gammaproteobacteria bacterium]
MPRVVEINIYPIKSCGRIERASAVVEPRGLEGDRRYMLVDENGEFLTQRRHPRLALLRSFDEGERGFRIEGPEREPLHLPWRWPEGPAVDVKIWRSQVEATGVSPEAGEWFSDYLGLACRVVFLAEHQHRAVPNEAAQFDDEVGFADAAPLLVISEASLAALNARLPEPMSMRRFRPNLVVTADAPFAEDEWKRMRIAAVELEIAWASARCVLTTIDPDTAIPDPRGEPLRTLREFRRGARGVLFGQNVIPRKLGTIRVGDSVEVA